MPACAWTVRCVLAWSLLSITSGFQFYYKEGCRDTFFVCSVPIFYVYLCVIYGCYVREIFQKWNYWIKGYQGNSLSTKKVLVVRMWSAQPKRIWTAGEAAVIKRRGNGARGAKCMGEKGWLLTCVWRCVWRVDWQSLGTKGMWGLALKPLAEPKLSGNAWGSIKHSQYRPFNGTNLQLNEFYLKQRQKQTCVFLI